MMRSTGLCLLCIAGAALAGAPSEPDKSPSAAGTGVDSAPSASTPADSSDNSGGAAPPPVCPGEGSCCEFNNSPGCNDQTCCETVCALDPECCSFRWDNICVSVAETHCPTVCSTNPACPSPGDCCTNHGGTGCEVAFCCDLVCANTPSCCDAVWSQGCADLAKTLCPDDCPDEAVCPGTGDCCTANGTPGCYDECCCSAVCADSQFASCCTTEWTQECATAAASMCPSSCAPPEPGCPAPGSCFETHFTPGCEDEQCCSVVCAADPDDWCCNFDWDSICVGMAIDLCTCNPPVCPGEGECCEPNGTPGCFDVPCCETVCQDMPHCCDSASTWDEACAAAAQTACICKPPTCPEGPITKITPADGWMDAGQPHPSATTTPQFGAAVLEVAGPPGADAECWSLCETTQNVGRHPTIGGNAIVSVSEVAPGTYMVTLDHPINPGERTQLSYQAVAVSSLDYIALPADVDMNGTSDPSDIISVIDCINNVASFPCDLANADVDRSGVIDPSDIIIVIDLLNGASAFESWFGAQVIDTGECP